ncbi:phosphotransferase [Halovivax cerinus]|uniref:Phosphotransferase n=1 Tax=Halovivax cerinus TaxID=1487865 RepID=A0ABD5NTF3_9EURY|nr:phosphotransferase [Halovivax cerinus]
MVCDHCDAELVERYGIVSCRPADEPSSWPLSEATLAEFARTATTMSIRTAADEVLGDHPHRESVLSTVFDVQQDLWLPLVAEYITGRCLDLNAGYGRRSMVLAEHAKSVYAVEASLDKLRIVAVRDDYASAERVTPVHSTDRRLPFRDDTFQTVVADFTGERVDRSRLERVRRYLSDDGSLVFLADGWPSRTGLTERIEPVQTDRTGALGVGPGTANGYRTLAADAGFDDVSVYALFPTASRPLYAFDVENAHAIPQIFDAYANEHGALGTAVEKLMRVANRSGLVKRCYPSLLVVCSTRSKPSPFGFDDPLVVGGRARSIVLDVDESGISDIHKVPNRATHEPYTERENRVTSALSSSDAAIAETIPNGDSLQSPFGSVRRVVPAEGRPLDDAVGRDVDSMERILRIGYEWLADFQRTYGGDPIERSPAEIRTEMRCSPANIDPPAVDAPATTFSTPVHGDFMSSNIYFDGRTITSVIDWEYGAPTGSPIVDAGYLLLNTAAWLVGDFEDRVRTVLCDDTELGERARSCVRRYCDAVDLPYRTFEVYLPMAYLHQLVLDWEYDAVGTYTALADEQRHRVVTLIELLDDMSIAE